MSIVLDLSSLRAIYLLELNVTVLATHDPYASGGVCLTTPSTCVW